MSINSLDGLCAALPSGSKPTVLLPSGTSVAGGFTNLNRLVTGGWGQMAIPTVRGSGGHIPAKGTTGFPTYASPGGGQSLYLAKAALTDTSQGVIIIADRVFAASGFDGTLTTAQTITSPAALTRSTDGQGLEIWLESYTAVGATASNVTVQYTNTNSTSGQNTVSEAIIASFPIGRTQPLRLAAGDTGVLSIQSVTLSASTGTAGNFGVALYKRLATIPCPAANMGTVLDFAGLGLPLIQDNAALTFIHLASGTSTGTVIGEINIVAG